MGGGGGGDGGDGGGLVGGGDGAGATGYKLIKFAEDYCRDIGVSLMMINTKVHIPFDKLMIGMGFDLIERVYSKFLGK